MAELADAPDLGSGPNRVWVRVPLGAGKGGKAGRAFRSFSLSPLYRELGMRKFLSKPINKVIYLLSFPVFLYILVTYCTNFLPALFEQFTETALTQVFTEVLAKLLNVGLVILSLEQAYMLLTPKTASRVSQVATAIYYILLITSLLTFVISLLTLFYYSIANISTFSLLLLLSPSLAAISVTLASVTMIPFAVSIILHVIFIKDADEAQDAFE